MSAKSRLRMSFLAALPVPVVMTLLYINSPTWVVTAVAYFGGCATGSTLLYSILHDRLEDGDSEQ